MLFDLNDEEMHKIRDIFKKFDKDGSLSLEINELENLYRTLGYDFKNDEIMEMVKYMDLNQDGRITFHEFLGSFKERVVFKAHEEKLREAFNLCDCDEDQYITLDELKRIMRQVGENLKEKHLISMLKEVDRDKDNRLNFEEFIQLMKNK